MKTPSRHRRILLFTLGMLIVASTIVAAVFSAKRLQRRLAQDSVPQILSNVKDLEAINARIVRANTETSGIAFEVFNKSNRAVMAIRIKSGNAAISKDGLRDDEHPIVVIEPHGLLPVEMTELTPNAPIIIASATFQDLKEEGEQSSIDFMRTNRKHYKKERDKQSAEKGPKP